MAETCPICTKRISDWMKACGKTISINGIETHKACLADVTIADLEARK